MAALELAGHPAPDKDGTLWVEAVRKGDKVSLCCNGHDFVVCEIVDNKPVVRVVDVDTGTKFETDFGLLCWRR